ncbi:acid resistance repetitive basic protein Asr [Klebsiella variicola subsp. variicola]|nr:acid resistance repetitive basic protein Asr [Klebsiella variicola subsp. variicola]
MKKVLALVVAAAMGLSSAAFAADAVSTTQAPAATHSTAAKTTHHKKHLQSRGKTSCRAESSGCQKNTKKAEAKPAAAQKAQAAKKHKKSRS